MVLVPFGWTDSPDSSRPTAAPMKPTICNLIRPTLSTRKMATMTPKTNSTSIMAEPLALRLLADDGAQNRRCEDADAVDAQVLQEPRNRGQDRRATVSLLEQRRIGPVTFGGLGLGLIGQVS